jgi:propionyl-CoA synthetase
MWNILVNSLRVTRRVIQPHTRNLKQQGSVTYATSTKKYEELYRQSINNPEKFWGEAATKSITWFKPFDQVLDRSNPPFYRWFKGGIMNTCYNCLDVQVQQGRGDQVALIWDSPVSNSIKKFTYNQLLVDVRKFAKILKKMGVQKGDRIVIYMPMIPEAAVAMLACARVGAVHSVVFGGFASDQLASRINHAKPELVITANFSIEPTHQVEYKPLLDHAIELSEHKPRACIIYHREISPGMKIKPAKMHAGFDYDWQKLMHDVVIDPKRDDTVEYLSALDPLYILYTSGTTGNPKGVVRDNGGHAVALKWSLSNVFDIQPGDVWWAASDIGWAVGHSLTVYGPLMQGATAIMYEGKPVGTPDAGAFWRVLSEHKAKSMFAAPTAIRAMKREDPEGKLITKYDLSSLKTVFLAGERVDPDTLLWTQSLLKDKPVIDHWWQTETAWPVSANSMVYGLFDIKPGSCGKPVPGYDVQIFDPDGHSMPPGHLGDVVIKLPLPPGCLVTLYQNDEGFKEAYFNKYDGFYRTGDAGMFDADGYLHILSRVDDIIKVAGHRLATGSIEEALAAHPDVAECAVIGVEDAIKGEVPLGLVVLKSGVHRDHQLIVNECIERVRHHVGPVAAFRKCLVVHQLPKTRSGKILRATLRQIANSLEFKVPPTIDNASALDHVIERLHTIGHAQKHKAK